MELSTSLASHLTLTDNPAMSGTGPVLPPEVLVQIIRDAYRFDDEKSTIFSCLLVSQEWRDMALPFLYKDLVLAGSGQMERFLDSHNSSAVRSITRSLTIYLRECCNPSSELQERIDNTVCRLAKEVIPNIAALKSFSLTTNCRDFKLGILRKTISTVLEALPQSCVNLELDTGGKDEASFWLAYHGRNRLEGVSHLCHDLRRMLPRMHNVRINLKSMCDAMFGGRFPDQGFHSIDLPHIRHLLIETSGTGARPPCPTSPRKEHSAWRQIIRALQHVAGSQETAPGELTVLGTAIEISRAGTFYQTLMRCHVRGGDDGLTTFAFPATDVPSPNSNYKRSLLVRTEEGGFVVDRIDSYYDIAGGRPWRLAANGARLPVSLFPDTIWASDGQLGIVTEAKWRERYPAKECTLWEKEREMGMRLVDFEERKNDIRLRTVVERSPEDVALGRPFVSPGDVDSEEEEDSQW
ncbi:Hypothetical protein NCS54_00921600 [Fusarium falciforme]|uniref:Hypothetical protein n=1 Tax=Fusarium falciforme TaxID=195108 RepID=UPI002301D8DB|nr:Hypothetical protein NCS54_00921600 [Fusarium falciforme]WAO91735.1 Hypothetical protein NCS54_00921600 [Fusarium falciforme]